MSHLLTRLADRAMGLVPAIEPVRTPVFGAEPAALAQTTARERGGYFYGDILADARAARPGGIEQYRPAAHTPADRYEPGENSASSSQPAQGGDLHEPSLPFRDIASQQASNRPRRGHDSHDSSVLTGSRPERIETGTADPAVETSAHLRAAPLTSQSTEVSTAVDERVATAEFAVAESPAASVPEKGLNTESSLRPKDFMPLSVSPGDLDTKLPRETNGSRQQPPSIRVSIGRIDVRAVTAAPTHAPKKSKKTRPSLSLDDYLRQRSGGHR